jgi:hypothetical protein
LLNVQPWYGQRNDVVFPFSALQPVAAVGTAVGQDPDHAVLAAYHHHGFGRDALGHVVAWLGDFALVGHEHPALAEDALHLQAEHLRGGVHAAVIAGRAAGFAAIWAAGRAELTMTATAPFTGRAQSRTRSGVAIIRLA